MTFELHHGRCELVLTTLPADIFDSGVTDPPYGLSFMLASWDHEVPPPEHWREVLRVLKPGAALLAFGGTRTYHRLVCAIEDAGFEVRDQLEWIHAQGFPKSHNGEWGGTALKPAHEPIVLARKPFKGTVAANFAAHGTGGLNIDASRISTREDRGRTRGSFPYSDDAWGNGHVEKTESHPKGRWPSNVLFTHAPGCELVGRKRVKGSGTGAVKRISSVGARGNALGAESRPAGTEMHSYSSIDGTEETDDWRCVEDCPVRLLDEQSGDRPTGVRGPGGAKFGGNAYAQDSHSLTMKSNGGGYGDRGGASRFFYCGKATRRERGHGNDHPTVKPLELMRYLVRLVTPAGGRVLDPYAGSGTTGIAALMDGFRFTGVEMVERHIKIARRRLQRVAPLLQLSAVEVF